VLATVVLTELITNNAAALLMFPIAIAAAAQAGLDPRGAAIAVAVAASASFLTPIGYQTNTMVYGPGGYHFSDYARLGAPLTIVMIATIVFAVPLFWPS
jgi:di/tricarboxylate transporter